MSDLKLVFSERVIASRVGNKIYINPDLDQYPELKNAALSHEKSHSASFNLNDAWMDITGHSLKGHKKDFYKFLITHPKTWFGMISPIDYLDGKWMINVLNLGLVMFIALVLWLVI